MATELGGYEDNASTKNSALRKVTVSGLGDKAALDVTPLNSLVPEAYDYIAATYPTTSSEVYTYKTGGASGTTVATVTVVYTDATKNVLSSVTKA